jgi:hypothetical protein
VCVRLCVLKGLDSLHQRDTPELSTQLSRLSVDDVMWPEVADGSPTTSSFQHRMQRDQKKTSALPPLRLRLMEPPIKNYMAPFVCMEMQLDLSAHCTGSTQVTHSVQWSLLLESKTTSQLKAVKGADSQRKKQRSTDPDAPVSVLPSSRDAHAVLPAPFQTALPLPALAVPSAAAAFALTGTADAYWHAQAHASQQMLPPNGVLAQWHAAQSQMHQLSAAASGFHHPHHPFPMMDPFRMGGQLQMASMAHVAQMSTNSNGTPATPARVQHQQTPRRQRRTRRAETPVPTNDRAVDEEDQEEFDAEEEAEE